MDGDSCFVEEMSENLSFWPEGGVPERSLPESFMNRENHKQIQLLLSKTIAWKSKPVSPQRGYDAKSFRISPYFAALDFLGTFAIPLPIEVLRLLLHRRPIFATRPNGQT